eukprot:scaffold1884_cov343-Ochromonas_danica.AAC.16
MRMIGYPIYSQAEHKSRVRVRVRVRVSERDRGKVQHKSQQWCCALLLCVLVVLRCPTCATGHTAADGEIRALLAR